jgi:putative transcriptional regulator
MQQAEIKLLEMMARQNIRQIKELAQKANISESIVAKILHGKKKGLRLDTITKLCVALDCRVDELIVLPEEIKEEVK